MNKKQKGRFGEFVARFWFRLHGYRILCKNYVIGRGTGAGEVDFIAKRGRTIVFVEVKERRLIDNAFYALHPQQQKRIRRAAEVFLQHHPLYLGFDVRFDVVLTAPLFHLKYIPNAFTGF